MNIALKRGRHCHHSVINYKFLNQNEINGFCSLRKTKFLSFEEAKISLPFVRRNDEKLKINSKNIYRPI